MVRAQIDKINAILFGILNNGGEFSSLLDFADDTITIICNNLIVYQSLLA